MSDNQNYSEMLRILSGSQKQESTRPTAPNAFSSLFSAANSSSVPSSPPSSNLQSLLAFLAPTNRPRPPVLSCAHMEQIVSESLSKKLDVNPGRQLPTIYDLAIGEGRRLNAAFVYADLHGYSKLVSTKGTEVSFLLVHALFDLVARITSHFGGAVVDCAGDRTLSVFYRPDSNNTRAPIHEAITAALWIQTAMNKVLSPRFAKANISGVSVSIGIDYGKVTAGCVGLRGNKRLVFLGDAANAAAKLQEQGGPGETVLSPLIFVNKPGYLDNGSWQFQAQYDPLFTKILFYKTSYLFAGDIPPGKDLYLR